MAPRVLILGGTGEARQLATRLVDLGMRVTSSLAGRVNRPHLPDGEVRIGGFGGVAGLMDWLRREQVHAVVDATHPFARTMSEHAARATEAIGVPVLALRRRPWQPDPGDDWRPVPSLEDAAELLPDLGERILVTTGRQGLAHFAALRRQHFVIRTVEPPEPPLPPRTTTLLSRGPFTTDGELELLRDHRIDAVVTKNSGGTMTTAKLTAARELGLPVVMVQRPRVPEVPEVGTVDEAVSRLRVTVRGTGAV